MLLCCEVNLGRILTVDKATPKMNANGLKKKGFDSLFAPRNSKGTGNILQFLHLIH